MNDKTITDIPSVPVPPKEPILTEVQKFAAEAIRAERQKFVDEAFLKALPIALTVRDWTRKGEQGSAVTITTQTDRIKLAWEIAQECYATRLTVK